MITRPNRSRKPNWWRPARPGWARRAAPNRPARRSRRRAVTPHNRAEFSCGHGSLDNFLRQFAGQNQKTGVSRTFVALKPGERIVRGYYSLAAGSVKLEDLSEQQRKRLPRYPVPVAHLGRLAVDQSVQGQGLGLYLLVDALGRVARADRDVGIHAVEVVAINDSAKRFYLKYGFTELGDDPHHLFISIKTVRGLGLV